MLFLRFRLKPTLVQNDSVDSRRCWMIHLHGSYLITFPDACALNMIVDSRPVSSSGSLRYILLCVQRRTAAQQISDYIV